MFHRKKKILTAITVMIYNRSVLWIRSGFNVDPVPGLAFYLMQSGSGFRDPKKATRIQANPDPELDPCSTLKSQKVEIPYLHE
jgi:hypothetical protein